MNSIVVDNRKINIFAFISKNESTKSLKLELLKHALDNSNKVELHDSG